MGDQELKRKFRGPLLGVAVGDALGAPFEGMPSVSQFPGQTYCASFIAKRAQFLTLYGRYSHDFGGGRIVVGKAKFRWGSYGRDLCAQLRRRAVAWIGAGPPQVFSLLRKGVPWNQASRMLFAGAGSYGNGAAMRVTPIALVYYQSTDEMIEVARRSARITHAHAMGVEGAVLQAVAIVLLLGQASGARISGTAFAERLAARVSSPLYVQQWKLVQELLPDAAPPDVVSKLGNGIEAFQAVPAAIYAFLRHPLSFSEAVRYAISLGGDTDTIASMTGALSGAYLGDSAIPISWRENVEGSARLCALADDLLELALRRDK